MISSPSSSSEGWSSHYSAFLFRRKLIRGIPHRQDLALRDDRLFILKSRCVSRAWRSIANRLVHRRHAGERLQYTSGLGATSATGRTFRFTARHSASWRRAGELTLRRKRAAIRMAMAQRAVVRAGLSAARWRKSWTGSTGSIPSSCRRYAPRSLLPTKCWASPRPSGCCGSGYCRNDITGCRRARSRRAGGCAWSIAFGFYFPDSTGGTEVYVRDLVTALSRHAIDSTIIAATDGSYTRYSWNGVEVVRYPIDAPEIQRVRDRSVSKRRTMFQELVEVTKPDLFHLHSWTSGAGLRHLRQVARMDIPAAS